MEQQGTPARAAGPHLVSGFARVNARQNRAAGGVWVGLWQIARVHPADRAAALSERDCLEGAVR